jgi:spermidine synthase
MEAHTGHSKTKHTLGSNGRLILGAAFGVGFLSLVYELYSFEVVFLFLNESSKTFATVLSAFLFGLALAALLVSRYMQKKTADPYLLLGGMQALGIVYAVVFLLDTSIIQKVSALGQMGGGWIWISSIGLWFFVFLPAFILGGSFPLLNGLYQKNYETRYQDVGKVYFWDTFGAILGVLIAGFLLFPSLGLKLGLFVPLCLAWVLTVFFVSLSPLRVRSKILGAILLLVVLVLGGIYAFGRPEEHIEVTSEILQEFITYEKRFKNVVFQQPSEYGVITIGESLGHHTLFIDYRDMCTTSHDTHEKTIGQLVAREMKPDSHVVNLGLGCGFTAREIVNEANVARLDVYEINSIVIDINDQYFGYANGYIVHDEKVKVVHGDGADYLRSSKEYVDAIIMDIEEPSVIQSSVMYTQEYMQLVKAKLREGGIYGLWSVFGGSEFHEILLNTVQSVFPYVYEYDTGGNYIVLIASENKLENTDGYIAEGHLLGIYDESTPINTIDNRALDSSFSLEKVFNYPENYEKEIGVDE